MAKPCTVIPMTLRTYPNGEVKKMKGIYEPPWKIQAIVANPDKEWQTRRVIKPQPERGVICKCPGDDISFANFEMYQDMRTKTGWIPIGESFKPRYRVGETVYIKEAWHFINIPEDKATPYSFGIEYADGEIRWWTDNGNEMDYPLDEKHHSPMMMPEKYARYFIKITGVRPCRTKDISFEDCLAEGVVNSPFWPNLDYKAPEPLNPADLSNAEADKEIDRGWIEYARQVYFALYDSINGKGAHERNWDFKYVFKFQGLPR